MKPETVEKLRVGITDILVFVNGLNTSGAQTPDDKRMIATILIQEWLSRKGADTFRLEA